MADTTKLDAKLMADRMYEALERRGVEVDFGSSGWRKLLEAIAEGVIDHLHDHQRALNIVPETTDHQNHQHGGYVRVQKTT